jgi:outer membrane cobalamin receptor
MRGLVLAGLLCAPLGANAQDVSTMAEEKQQLESVANDPVVRMKTHVSVTASPVIEGTLVEPLAGGVTSVGREQIEDLSAQDIASALRRVPGVVISRYNPVGSYGGGDGGGLFIRGMGAGRPGAEIATMVDGVAKFSGVWTHPLLDTLSVDLLERVDVYKSAQPVLFGNMSFAGVNLVPRQRASAGYSGRVTAAYGSFDTSALTADSEGKHGRLSYSVALSQRQSDGQRLDANGRTRALFGRAGVDLGRGWEAAFLYDGTTGSADDPGVLGAVRPAVTPRFDVTDSLGVLSLTRRHGEQSGFVKVSLDDGSIDWRQWSASLSDSYNTLTDWRNLGLKAQDTFGVLGRGALTVGAELQSYGGDARERYSGGPKALGDFRFQNRAVYAAYAHTFGERINLTPSAGIRYNDSREFGGDWGGQAGLTVKGDFGEAYVRFARAFNLPGVWVAVSYQGYGRGEQWRSLGPERARHLELGFARALGTRARIETAAFRIQVEDALRFVPPPPPPPAFANVGDYRAQGVELSLTVEPLRDLALMAGWTYTETRPELIPYTPKVTIVSGAVFSRGRWRVSSDAQYVDKRFVGNLRYPGQPQKVDAYFLLNGRVALRLGKQNVRGPEVFIAGENLTGADYAFRPGYPMPGRSVLSGLAWGF